MVDFDGAKPFAERLDAIRHGGKVTVAAELSRLEHSIIADETLQLLDEAFGTRRAGMTIGITGPPGAGKSTLIDGLVRDYRARDKTVAVLAVDPSSARTGGALLGDRVRMQTDPADQGVFVRSIAARGRLGGLSDAVFPSVVLLRALYDSVIVESVGVGQSETDIALVADTIVLCVQPGSGDALQFMKAGILEIPDIAVVTKADMGAVATRALADLQGALSLSGGDRNGLAPVCLAVSVKNASGIEKLIGEIEAHQAWMLTEDRLAQNRARQVRAWTSKRIEEEYGRAGVKAIQASDAPLAGEQPFASLRSVMNKLSVTVQLDPE